VFELAPDGSETVLAAFSSANFSGAVPTGGVIMDARGNLYGTTSSGGAPGGCSDFAPPGCGTVFQIAPDGTLTIIYSFSGGNDGGSPFGGLVADKHGNFYGTTYGAGAHSDGTVFALSPRGNLTTLYAFTGATDGANPYGGVATDAHGNLYGTTLNDGANCPNYSISGCGTVFRIAN
jgi:uncharacterized repeat protein (TIGR03803 family)